MTKRMRSQLVLALVVAVAGTVGFAQSGGEAVYKANCVSCHGSTGTPNPGIAKAMGVKPANDPDYKKTSEADMTRRREERQGQDEGVRREIDRRPDQGFGGVFPFAGQIAATRSSERANDEE